MLIGSRRARLISAVRSRQIQHFTRINVIGIANLRIRLDKPADRVIRAKVIARDGMQGVAPLDAHAPRFRAIIIRPLIRVARSGAIGLRYRLRRCQTRILDDRITDRSRRLDTDRFLRP